MEGLLELLVLLAAFALIPLLRSGLRFRRHDAVRARAGASMWPSPSAVKESPIAEPAPRPPPHPTLLELARGETLGHHERVRPAPEAPTLQPARGAAIGVSRPTRDELRRAIVWSAVLGAPIGQLATPGRRRRPRPRRAH